MATTMFPKWQISFFHGNDKKLQSVFRTEDKAEYDAQLKEWLKEEEINEALNKATPTTQPVPLPLPPKPAEYCPDCGEVKVMGKKGLYCKPCYITWAKVNKPQGYKTYS